jgi:hypothetical protein
VTLVLGLLTITASIGSPADQLKVGLPTVTAAFVDVEIIGA